jgi:hypothetical protein
MMIQNHFPRFWTKFEVVEHLVEVCSLVAFNFYQIKLIVSYRGGWYKLIGTKWIVWGYKQNFCTIGLKMMEFSYQKYIFSLSNLKILLNAVKLVKNHCDSLLRFKLIVNLFLFLSVIAALLVNIINYLLKLLDCWIAWDQLNYEISFYIFIFTFFNS